MTVEDPETAAARHVVRTRTKIQSVLDYQVTAPGAEPWPELNEWNGSRRASLRHSGQERTQGHRTAFPLRGQGMRPSMNLIVKTEPRITIIMAKALSWPRHPSFE